MKKLFILVGYFLANVTLSFSQPLVKRQWLIPLNNKTGVPYYFDADMQGYYLNGFEIDSLNHFYFLGGEHSLILAIFDGSKQLQRTLYTNMSLYTNKLYLLNDTLFTFNRVNMQNTLFLLKPQNGQVFRIRKISPGISINSYFFKNHSLIVMAFDKGPTPVYIQFALTGKPLKQVLNQYALPFNSFLNAELLGMWKGNFVFYQFNVNKQCDTFFLVDASGKTLDNRELSDEESNSLGVGYVRNPPEDRKVRNGNLYVLGRKGKFALITEIPLKGLFDIHN